MINLHANSEAFQFDASVSLAEAFQWGQMAFSEAQEDDDDPKHDNELITSVFQGLLARQTPANWSLGFAAGFVQAYLAAHQS
jgi:hypothetical protein